MNWSKNYKAIVNDENYNSFNAKQNKQNIKSQRNILWGYILLYGYNL